MINEILTALYERFEKEQREEVEQIRREELLEISPQIDYLNSNIGLSDEVKHLLDQHRPQTVVISAHIPDGDRCLLLTDLCGQTYSWSDAGGGPRDSLLYQTFREKALFIKYFRLN